MLSRFGNDVEAQSAWYIGKSHKMLDDVSIPTYAFGNRVTEAAAKKAAENAAKRGEKLHNLTLAYNDKTFVHTLKTQRAVWQRLSDKAGDKLGLETKLDEIGKLFMDGKVPRERVLK